MVNKTQVLSLSDDEDTLVDDENQVLELSDFEIEEEVQIISEVSEFDETLA